MAELNLNVQLKVAGQKRSDKYLISNVEKKKMKKKSKKKKHRSERYGKIIEIYFFFPRKYMVFTPIFINWQGRNSLVCYFLM